MDQHTENQSGQKTDRKTNRDAKHLHAAIPQALHAVGLRAHGKA